MGTLATRATPSGVGPRVGVAVGIGVAPGVSVAVGRGVSVAVGRAVGVVVAVAVALAMRAGGGSVAATTSAAAGRGVGRPAAVQPAARSAISKSNGHKLEAQATFSRVATPVAAREVFWKRSIRCRCRLMFDTPG